MQFTFILRTHGNKDKKILKANVVTTLFCQSKPKQKREWSKHSDVSAKKKPRGKNL